MRQGKITAYSEKLGLGMIRTKDNELCVFAKSDWQSQADAPTVGMTVTFDSNDAMALKVMPLKKHQPPVRATILSPGASTCVVHWDVMQAFQRTETTNKITP